MDRNFAEHTTESTVPTSNHSEDFQNHEIGEALAFDENDEVVSIEADAEALDITESDLLELLDDTEDASPQMMGLLAAPRASSSQSRPTKSSIVNSVLSLVNQQRQRRGKHPLRLDSRLTRAAQSHSDDMARRQKMSHIGSDRSSVGTRVKRTGYKYHSVAENVARGQDTPRDVVIAWLKSPGHRENLLSSKYTEIGIGIAYSARGPYWTQVFAKGR